VTRAFSVRKSTNYDMFEVRLTYARPSGNPSHLDEADQDAYFGVESLITGIQAVRSSLTGGVPVRGSRRAPPRSLPSLGT
jgi:hypothetical protein